MNLYRLINNVLHDYMGVKLIRSKKKRRVTIDLRMVPSNLPLQDVLAFQSENNVKYLIKMPIGILKSSILYHVWVKVLRLYENEDKQSAMQNTSSFLYLQNYFESFQPNSVAEYIGVSNDQGANNNFLDSPALYTVLPWSKRTPAQQFNYTFELMRKEFKEHNGGEYKKDDGWKAFGPSNLNVITLEYKRLIKAYESLKKNGYIESYGLPHAQIFKKENKYLITPRGAWHRTAAMIALGFDEISLYINSTDSIIDRKDVASWPQVKSGLYNKELALELFDKKFESIKDTNLV